MRPSRFRQLIAPTALALALTASAGAQDKRPMSFLDVIELPTIQDPRLSPDGKQIVFTSFRDGDAEIYLMDADGSGQLRLTSNGASDRLPAWSPDGTQIAFTTDRDGNDEIYVMNTDGSGLARLTTDPASDSYPAWSPDGRQIAFASVRDGNAEIYVMNADGSGQSRVTNDPGFDFAPDWTPHHTGDVRPGDQATSR